MEFNIKELREQWATKLHELLQQRKNIDIQIMGIQQMLRGSAVLTEDPIPSEYTLGPIPLPPWLEGIRTVGLTDAVRMVLSTRGGPLTAKQIRDRLESYDYPLTQQNQMAAVHQVISRLVKQGEIRKVAVDGKTQFVWVSSLKRALLEGEPGSYGLFAPLSVQAPETRAAIRALGYEGVPVNSLPPPPRPKK